VTIYGSWARLCSRDMGARAQWGQPHTLDITPRATVPFALQTIEKFTALRPLLARSAIIATKVDLDRINAANSVFEVMGIPAAAQTGNGRVIDCNASFAAF
jgi:hypothetical protein